MDALLSPISLMTELHIFKIKNLDLELKSKLPIENLHSAENPRPGILTLYQNAVLAVS